MRVAREVVGGDAELLALEHAVAAVDADGRHRRGPCHGDEANGVDAGAVQSAGDGAAVGVRADGAEVRDLAVVPGELRGDVVGVAAREARRLVADVAVDRVVPDRCDHESGFRTRPRCAAAHDRLSTAAAGSTGAW